MLIEIESGCYEFRYSYRTEDGSLAVDIAYESIDNKKHLFRYMANLKLRLKEVYGALEPINISYKRA